jgi:hypothetical protein
MTSAFDQIEALGNASPLTLNDNQDCWSQPDTRCSRGRRPTSRLGFGEFGTEVQPRKPDYFDRY